MEMNVLKEEVYTHTNPEIGGPACRTGSSRGRDGNGQARARVLNVVFVGRKEGAESAQDRKVGTVFQGLCSRGVP